MQNIVNQFSEKIKEKGLSDPQAEEILFIAMNVALAETLKEIEKEGLLKLKDKIKTTFADKTQYFNIEKVDAISKEVANSRGETVSDVVNRNLDSFLSKL